MYPYYRILILCLSLFNFRSKVFISYMYRYSETHEIHCETGLFLQNHYTSMPRWSSYRYHFDAMTRTDSVIEMLSF
jgi:hypothetical protein